MLIFCSYTMKCLASAVLLASIVASLNAATLEFDSKPCDQCDRDSTCCISPSGSISCCQVKKGVCCSDGVNCCPRGTKCNLEAGTCDTVSGNVTRPAVRKQQSASDVTSPLNPDNMVCTDHSQCPQPGAACCRQYTGRYGCCNYPLNVCCDDGVHCCHTGTVCDQLRLLCIRYPPADSQPLVKTVASVQWVAEAEVAKDVAVQAVEQTSDENKCPDPSPCANTSTCCLTKTGGYSCCPHPRATCCPDLIHCCQSTEKCTSTGCRIRGSEAIVPWAAVNAMKP